MANTKNLKSNSERTPKERKELARKAGKVSGKKRRERKALKELLEIALTLPNEETGETNQLAITSALIKQAIKGNVLAYTTIRDTIGEKPIDKKELTGKDGEPLAVKKVFITPEQQKAVKKHIKDVINGGNI